MKCCSQTAVTFNKQITVYPKKYAHGFCFVVLCCGYTLTDFPISIRLTSLALVQSNDCPSASKATLMNMDKYFMWIHYERLHNHNKAKQNKTVCIFRGIYCMYDPVLVVVVALVAVAVTVPAAATPATGAPALAAVIRGYPAKSALSVMRKHGRWGPFGRIPSNCSSSSIGFYFHQDTSIKRG